MKPIWFSLFDFYTAAECREGRCWGGEEVAEAATRTTTGGRRRTGSSRPHNPVTLGVTPRQYFMISHRKHLAATLNFHVVKAADDDDDDDNEMRRDYRIPLQTLSRVAGDRTTRDFLRACVGPRASTV